MKISRQIPGLHVYPTLILISEYLQKSFRISMNGNYSYNYFQSVYLIIYSLNFQISAQPELNVLELTHLYKAYILVHARLVLMQNDPDPTHAAGM